MKYNYAKLWRGLGLLILLTPLGLLAEGTAWGEWSLETLSDMTGFTPIGMEKWSEFWKYTLIPEYAFPGMEGNFLASSAGYILSAVIGLVLIHAIMTALGKWMARNDAVNN